MSGFANYLKKRLIAKIGFKCIVLLWLAIIFGFAVFFVSFSGGENFLYYATVEKKVTGFGNALYFSFITATTTGYGDIIPFGAFKVAAVIEALFGLAMLSVIVSKIISLKQDVILSEIYDLSYREEIGRLRSSLFRFRHNIEKITKKARDKTISKQDIEQLYIYLYNFEDTLHEILMIQKRSNKYDFLNNVETLGSEVVKAITSSFKSVEKMFNAIGNKKWKSDINVRLLKSCIETGERIFYSFLLSEELDGETRKEIKEQMNETLGNLRKHVND